MTPTALSRRFPRWTPVPRPDRRPRTALLALVLLLAATVLGAGAAPSGAGPAPAVPAAAVAADPASAARGLASPAAPVVRLGPGLRGSGPAPVQVATDAATGVVLGAEGSPRVAIALDADGTGDGEVRGSDVVYRAPSRGTTRLARITEDGAQILIAIEGPRAPVDHHFPVSVDGQRAHLRVLADGGVEVRGAADGPVVASFQPPWARDAAGRAVATHFEVRGSVVVQHVAHRGSAYPVVADPHTCGIATCTYYFTKSQTRDIASASAAAGACTVIGRIPVAGSVLGAVCGIYAAAILVQASRAKNRGMCLKIKHPRPGGGPLWPDIYSGGSCR